jgi:hypothetical protein
MECRRLVWTSDELSGKTMSRSPQLNIIAGAIREPEKLGALKILDRQL